MFRAAQVSLRLSISYSVSFFYSTKIWSCSSINMKPSILWKQVKICSQETMKTQTPLLMLFPQEDEYADYYDKSNDTFRFLNLAENKVLSYSEAAAILPQNQFRCVGSSHGWLIFLHKKGASFYLLNPLSGTGCSYISPKESTIQGSIVKAVLSSDPLEKKNAVVIAIYTVWTSSKFAYRSKLAYRKCGDFSWEEIDGKNQSFCDIMYYNDVLFAVSETGSVQVWDFLKGFPQKIMYIGSSYPRKSLEAVNVPSLNGLCSSNLYLVESNGDILLVVRVVGDLVNGHGEAVTEADLLTDKDSHPLVCPYRTLFFHVYTLDSNQKRWMEMDSLGGQSLFLGGNQSMAVLASDFPGCRENCIYFTDDCWDRMDEDYLYGGHDMGVFSLKDQNIKPFYEWDTDRIVPPPFWVVPSPLSSEEQRRPAKKHKTT